MKLIKTLAILVFGYVFLGRGGSAVATTLVDLSLQNYSRSGFVTSTSQQVNISTATGAQNLSVLEKFIGTKLTGFGIEGSAASYTVGAGSYEVTWQLYTEDMRVDTDYFGVWNGKKLVKLADTDDTLSISRLSKQSAWIKTIINTESQLSFFTLDTSDRAGSTVAKIGSIKRRVPEPRAIFGFGGIALALVSLKLRQER
jgi:hypothetical protein